MVVTEAVLAVVALFVVAGGGIIVIDALIIRRLRHQGKSRRNES